MVPDASIRKLSGAPYTPRSTPSVPSRVDDVELVRIAELRQPQTRLRGIVLVVHADDPQAALFVNAQQFGVFGAARRAPGRPDVDEHGAAHVRPGQASLGAVLRVERGQVELRERFTDERGRQLMRIVQTEPGIEQRDDHHECRQRNEKARSTQAPSSPRDLLVRLADVLAARSSRGWSSRRCRQRRGARADVDNAHR